MRALIALILMAVPAAAQDSLAFSKAPVVACLQGGDAQESCIGLAAQACMETPGGATTVGMGFCLGAERDFWDARLNAAYLRLMSASERVDSEMAALKSSDAPRAPALRDMQRSWIDYRDAACRFEATQWGSGSGAGPAATQCVLTLTARQSFWLENYLVEGQ